MRKEELVLWTGGLFLLNFNNWTEFGIFVWWLLCKNWIIHWFWWSSTDHEGPGPGRIHVFLMDFDDSMVIDADFWTSTHLWQLFACSEMWWAIPCDVLFDILWILNVLRISRTTCESAGTSIKNITTALIDYPIMIKIHVGNWTRVLVYCEHERAMIIWRTNRCINDMV